MLLYSLFIIITIVTILNLNKVRQRQLQIVSIMCFVSFLLTGLRWNYGGDWDNYIDYFTSIRNLDFTDSSFEFGWVILSYIVKITTNSYTIFQFVIASVFYYCIRNSIGKLSVVPILSYFVYFALDHGGINYVRTGIATCIIIYSLVFANEQNLKKYLLTWFIAFSIHFSAFVALPLYWIYRSSISFKKYFFIFLGCVLFFYVSGKLFLSDFSLLGPYVQYKLDKYITAQEAGEYFGSNMTVEVAMANYLIKKAFVFLFLFLFCRKALQCDTVFRGITNIYIVGTIFYCSVVPIAMQFGRMSGYMDGTEIFIVPFIYKNIPQKTMKHIFLFLTIVMNIVRIKGHLDPTNPLIYDYHWILF